MRRSIGATSLTAYPIGLGAMPLSLHGQISEDQIRDVIHSALEAGIDLIDTANVYCTGNHDLGLNERSIAATLKTMAAENVIVATKGGLERPQGRWERKGAPQQLRRACEQSLRDLDVEVISLYQLHAPDPAVPFAESVDALAQLRSEGKILHIGLSNVDQNLLDEALAIAPIASVQNRCSVLHQKDLRNGFVEYCQSKRIAYIAYSPVGGGSGRYLLEENAMLDQLAQAHQSTVYQIALAWLLHKYDNILPIPGASRASSAVSSAHAATLSLTDDEVYQLDCLDR